MLKPKQYIYFILVLTFFLPYCSQFRKIEKSDDLEAKYKAAIEYFEGGDYYRASVLLEQILPLLRGDKRAEKAQYYYAYSHFHQKLYIQSAYYFKLFYQTYSRSEFAEESMYMHAFSLYQDSPAFNLDQSSTLEAVEAMQNFLNKYPQTEYKAKGNDIINKLREKLEDKAYFNAKEYYKLREYDPRNLKAAIIAFENFERDFPDSRRNEEITYLRIDAKFKLAQQSVPIKQKERYQETVKLYETFIDFYPESVYLKKAENIYKESIDKLNKNAKTSNL